ncbi:MAG: 3-dehydroquinate synthase II [Candidatus Pacebacteria bacterium]|nr:3-dehydroquinate synthase II [Candidatus Paceibacterota bacterium]
MKKFWYKILNWDKRLVSAAIESGFDSIYVSSDDVKKVRELSRIGVISNNKEADLVLDKDVKEIIIKSKESEKDIVNLNGKIPVIIKNKDWTIIPLENLISKTTNLIQYVENYKEAKVALETMEKGADGIVLETNDMNEIKKVGNLIREIQNEKLSLTEVEIDRIKQVGIGDRVVVDTSSILKPGQGILAGDSSSAMFLVYNENVQTPYCDPRPFRVNAGGVHAYVQIAGDKTKYLGELASGSKIMVVDQNGNTQEAIIGRVKIEKRPMLAVYAHYHNKKMSLIMQNAETIRLTKKDGSPISVTKLKKGDRVLANLEQDGVGRHFGQKIKETILEK